MIFELLDFFHITESSATISVEWCESVLVSFLILDAMDSRTTLVDNETVSR